MFVKTCWTVFLSAFLLHSASAQIERARIELNLGTLASDEMEGRKAGTPAEKRAAEFIAAQFKAAGLKPYNGASDFLQKFAMTNIEPKTRHLTLNDAEIVPGDYLFATQRESVSVSDLSTLTVFKVSPTDMSAISKARAFKGSKLVLVDPALGDQFRGYFQYFSQSQLVEEVDTSSMEIWAITPLTEVTSIRAEAVTTLSPVELMNVVGELPGSDDTLGSVLFSAHFDHLGRRPAVNGDEIANGADDDASGVTALIEIAHHYKARSDHKRKLIFAAFTAEELGGFGSHHFADLIDPATIAAGINIEMIGKLSKFGSGQGFITGYELSSLPPIMSKAVESSPYRLHPDPYPDQQLFYRSDNAEFARKGVPAHTVGSGQIDQDAYYHTVDDEIETLNMNHLEAMIRAIALGSEPIVNGSETPSRIEPGLPGMRGR